ncbi:MAG TPA: hypothetical protein VF316_20655 [Polyangiaceae bacterium]
MKKLSLLFVASAVAIGSAYACGGGEEPAKNPNDVPSASVSAAPSASASASADVTPSATASVAVTPPPVVEPPPLVVDGIKFSVKGKDGKPVVVEVKPDGTLVKDGKVVASFVKNELKDESGKTVFSVDKDGKVTGGQGMDKPMTFSDKDDLQIDGKPGIVIADDGTAAVTNGTKTEKAPFKFDKLPPKSKRAAVLLVGLMLFSHAAPTATAVSVSTPPTKPPPAPSAKPATKK